MGSRLLSFAAACVWSTLGSSCLTTAGPSVISAGSSARNAKFGPAPAPATRAAEASLASPPRGPAVKTTTDEALPPALADDATTDADPEEGSAPADVEAPKDVGRTPTAPAPNPARALASIAKETWIYAAPRWGSRRIGYLRAGAVVERAAAPAGRASCEKGWYHVEPRGYVCVGTFASLDVGHPVVVAAQRRADRSGLPYTYALSGPVPPVLYARVPGAAEAEKSEPELAGHLRAIGRHLTDPLAADAPALDEAPEWALAGKAAPVLGNAARGAGALEVGRPTGRSGFALVSIFDAGGRRWGLTTELALLPLDRTKVVTPSTFAGLALDRARERPLPVAFMKSRHAARWLPQSTGGVLRGDALTFREAVPLTGETRRIAGDTYLEATDGTLVRADQALRVDPPADLPRWATGERKWIDVSINQQTLVAYEGQRPVFVTLVSTGADGLGDPLTTHSTVQGLFRIHTKHVSVTMDDDAEGNAFDFRDVPFVQYFNEGFALHAAYWHDDFGTARSHGCVNLSPKDAAWLFGWTGPEVPERWHGALSRLGTLVRTRP